MKKIPSQKLKFSAALINRCDFWQRQCDFHPKRFGSTEGNDDIISTQSQNARSTYSSKKKTGLWK